MRTIKNYQDEVRRQMMAIQEKNGLRNASTLNFGNGMNTLINAFSMYNGGNLFGGNGGSNVSLPNSNQPVEPIRFTPQTPNTVNSPNNDWWSNGGFH